ncbi:MAG TPA: hypothetical protein VF120_12005 [Ktedonobacterales bacterium]
MKLEPGEQIVKEDKRSTYIKGKMNSSQGSLALTSQRLVFDRMSPVAYLFGALGMLLLGPLLPKKTVVSLPLGQIASFSRGKYGFNKNVVVLGTADGAEYRFGVSKYDQWAPVFAQAGIHETQPAGPE